MMLPELIDLILLSLSGAKTLEFNLATKLKAVYER